MDVSALKNTPLFADVPDEALTKVATFASLESVAEGKTIIREGGYSNDFYIIEDGTVKVEREGEHLADLGPGDVFGEQGLLEKQERSATVTATSPVRLIKIEHWELSRMKQAMPEVVDQLAPEGRRALQLAASCRGRSPATYGRWSREVRCETGAVQPLWTGTNGVA